MDKGWAENDLGEVFDEVPPEKADVTFGDKCLNEIGQILSPTEVQNPPTMRWTAEEDQFYSILMTDPDAPSRKEPKFKEWYHWGVINIPGNDISKGEEIAAYVGAGPPKETGKHRYVFLIFKQAGKINFTDKKLGLSFTGRASQKARDMVIKYNLGKIVAGACFQAEWDDYVPELIKKLTN